MIKSTFGKSDTQVTKLGFGAWAIGSRGYGKVERAEALATLEAYVSSGGNFIDTARAYGNSEEIVGEFIRAHGMRQELFICSKTGVVEKEEIPRELETTLGNLGTDYIDLYYIHSPPENPDKMFEVLDSFSNLKANGSLRAIGASIKGPSVTSATQDLCRQYINSGHIDAIQLIFSIFRQGNRAIFEEAKTAGVALVGRTTLESGFLTGRYQPGHAFPVGDHRRRWSQEKLNNVLTQTANLMKEPAFSHFDELAHMAIRFAYEEELLSTIIIGARDRNQVESHLKAVRQMALPSSWRDALIEKYSNNDTLGNL